MPTGKTVQLSVIFPGSNGSSMLDAIVVVAVSHNFPTREKQFSSSINNLCQVQREFPSPRISVWAVSFADFFVAGEVES